MDLNFGSRKYSQMKFKTCGCETFFKLNSLKEIVERKLDHNHDADNKKVLNRQKVSNAAMKKVVDVEFSQLNS